MYNYKKYSDAEKLLLKDMVLSKDDDTTLRNKWKKGVIDVYVSLYCVYVPKTVKWTDKMLQLTQI